MNGVVYWAMGMCMHTLVVQVYALAGHAHVGTCTSAIDLVHGFVNMHAAQPSVWRFSALVVIACSCVMYTYGVAIIQHKWDYYGGTS